MMMTKTNISTMRQVSQNLLNNRQFDIEFHGYLSNHAKHAIVALDRIEAPDERIREYWDEYTKMTPYSLSLHAVDTPWDQVQPCTRQQLNDWRGKKVGWQEMCVFLSQELETRFDGNVDRLVSEYAPTLTNGIAGALTHGIIHLGWGIDARNDWMTIEGLSYLNFCHIGIDESKLEDATGSSENTPMESMMRVAKEWEQQNLAKTWIERVKSKFDESFHPELVVAGFQWQLAKVLHEPHPVALQIPQWLSTTSIDDLWEPLYRLTTYLYLGTRDSHGNGNFLVLHSITSLWGLEHVLKVIDDEWVSRRALKQYYSMLICLLATSAGGIPPVKVLEQVQIDFSDKDSDAPDLNWTPILNKGMAEEEEHNIKLVYVMRELWNRFGRWKGFSEAARSFTLTPNIGPQESSFKVT
jgi:hypothetical protein